MAERPSILVLGLGNVLCGDDGAGVAAVHRLMREYVIPEGVVAADGGTLGLSLLPLVDAADQVFILDAVRADGPPGTFVRIEGDDVGPAVYERLSPHQVGVADLLAGAALIGRYPDRVIILGVVPETTDLGLGRTSAVEACVPVLVERAVAELLAVGFPMQRREEEGDAAPRSSDLVARTLGV